MDICDRNPSLVELKQIIQILVETNAFIYGTTLGIPK